VSAGALPLVSIVIPCHNYGRFLAEAVESALAQTYPNLEVIVIDDGSDDDSLEVARRYADRVRVLTQANAGLERTCNRGAAEANGEYLAIVSADDRIEPTYVAELHAAIRETGASFAYSAMRLFGAEDGIARAYPFSAFLLARGPNYVNGSALTLRSDYLRAGGYREELGDVALEDWDFWLKLVERGRRGTYVARPLLHWRRHERGSRNPEAADALERSLAAVRELHPELQRLLARRSARLSMAVDHLAVIADGRLGYARRRRAVRLVESRSWRSFRRELRRAGLPVA
jgi:glycosyltransferase involved in cell wall biosynthesis